MARKKLLLFCEFLLMLKSCIFIQGVTIPNVQRLSAARLFLEGVWSLRTGPPVGPAMVIEEKAG